MEGELGSTRVVAAAAGEPAVAGCSGKCSGEVTAERCSSPEVAAGCSSDCRTRCSAGVAVAVAADCHRLVKELGSTNPPRRFSEIVEVVGRRVAAASAYFAAGKFAEGASSCFWGLADTVENSAEEVLTAAAAAVAVNRDYFCRTLDH